MGYNISLNDNRHGIVERIRCQYWTIVNNKKNCSYKYMFLKKKKKKTKENKLINLHMDKYKRKRGI